MLHPTERIRDALSPLIGLPLWGARRTLNVECFHFGAARAVINRKGQEVNVGEYALHIQCPWRIVGLDGIVAGSQDRNYPADENADRESFDDETATSRLDARIESWLNENEQPPLKVDRIETDAFGGFQLFLTKGYTLEVFPADSRSDEYSERWRILPPTTEDPHFVVTGYGIEDP